MLTSLKIILKKHLPFYSYLRSKLFPYYEKKRAAKLLKMPKYGISTFSCVGTSFPLYLSSSNGFVDEEIYWKGCYEEEVLKTIKDVLPSGGTYVDIGSNIGQHALFASIINPEGKVLSFEPLPKLYRQFLDSVNLNNLSNITIYNKACGEEESTMNINFSTKNMGGASLAEAAGRESFETISVLQGDTILLSEPRIDLIKIDTEGFELEVLRGIINTIEKFKPILIIEYSPILYKGERKENGRNILDLLELKGYEITSIDDGARTHLTENLQGLAKDYPDQINIICKPLSLTML